MRTIPRIFTPSLLPQSTAVLALALSVFASRASYADVIPPQPITDINKQSADSDPADINHVGNKIYFTANDNKGRALFVKTLKVNKNNLKPAVDGKTTLVTRFKAGVTPDQFTVTGMQDLSFSHAKMVYHVPGYGLYSGAKKVKKVDLAPDNTGFRWLSSLAAFKDSSDSPDYKATRYVFSGEDKKRGVKLFISNGTPSGTKILANPGNDDFFPYGMVDSSGTLFFGATDTNGTQLWKSDGTAAATARVTNSLTVFPLYITASNTGGCFFSASTDSSQLRDLYYSDGTPNGTIALSSGSIAPYALTPFGGGMLFAAAGNGHGYELWYADNGQAYELTDINSGSNGSNPTLLTNAGDEQVYLSAFDGNSYKLYRSNGTPSSLTEIRTQQNASMVNVTAIVPAMIIYNGNQTLGDRVYFTTGSNNALWYVDNSDGNAVAYPVLTAQNNQITNATHLSKFVDNGIYRLYFNTDGAGTEFAGLGTELWVVGNDL